MENTFSQQLIEDYKSTVERDSWEPQDQNEDTTEERRALIFDGDNRGRRIGEAIQSLALEYGWDKDNYVEMDEEYYYDASDEAIAYLNSLLENTPYSFYQDEDFFFCETRDKQDEEAELDRYDPENGDIATEDHIHFYQYGKLYLTVPEDRDYRAQLALKMEADKFWPNVFFISDHGNTHLISFDQE